MTSDEIRAFCHEYAQAWERSDVTALVACYSEDCEVTSPIFHVLKGRKQVESSFRELFRAFADLKVSVDDLIVDRERGERAVLVFSIAAHHRGEIFGMTGSGRRIEVRGAFILTFAGGLIAKDVRIYDFSGMLMQLGVLKPRTL